MFWTKLMQSRISCVLKLPETDPKPWLFIASWRNALHTYVRAVLAVATARHDETRVRHCIGFERGKGTKPWLLGSLVLFCVLCWWFL